MRVIDVLVEKGREGKLGVEESGGLLKQHSLEKEDVLLAICNWSKFHARAQHDGIRNSNCCGSLMQAKKQRQGSRCSPLAISA